MYVIFVKLATCCHTTPQRQVCCGTALSVATQANVGMTVFAAMHAYNYEYLPQYLAACLFFFVSLFLVFQRPQASFNVLDS